MSGVGREVVKNEKALEELDLPKPFGCTMNELIQTRRFCVITRASPKREARSVLEIRIPQIRFDIEPPL